MSKKRGELRFGSNGSFSVVTEGPEQGEWYDHEAREGGKTWSLLRNKAQLHDEEIIDWVKRELGIVLRNGNNQRQHIVAIYDYTDEVEKLLFQVLRWGPKKAFSQRSPDGVGGWRKSVKGVRLVLYHLPEVVAARKAANGEPPRIYITEGEKDCDKLRQRWGLLATTCPMGAGKWRRDYNQYLAGFDVVLLGDNDVAGKKHVRQVAAALLPVAASVRIVEFDDLEDKGDVSLWIERGGAQDDFETLVELSEPLARPPVNGHPALLGESFAEIELKPVTWLWQKRIARGKLTLIAGHPGLGKSHISLQFAAVISAGGAWPDGMTTPPLGRVLILSAEDTPADTLGPRLHAVGADLARVFNIRAVPDLDEQGQPLERAFALDKDLDRLASLIEQFGDVVAVIIDPITAYMGEIDSHKMAEVRAVLHPLTMIADKYGVALLGITHLRKSGDGDAVLLVTGSLGFTAASRAVYFVLQDEKNRRRRLFLPAKNNLGIDSGGFAYTIEATTVAAAIETSRLIWEPGAVEGTADDELTQRRRNARKGEDTRTMEKTWLRDLLGAGPMATTAVKAEAKAAAFNWRTVQRAANDLGMITRKSGFGPDWEWELP